MCKFKSNAKKTTFQRFWRRPVKFLFLVVKNICGKFAAKGSNFERFPDEAPH